MTKPVPTPPVPPAASPVVADAGFTFEDAASFAKPVKAAGAGIGKGVVTETTKKLSAVPVGKTFLVPVTIDDAITNQDERNAAFATAAKAESTRVKGSARRLRSSKTDTTHANKNFTIEIVSSAELGYGVRVWRDEDTAAA